MVRAASFQAWDPASAWARLTCLQLSNILNADAETGPIVGLDSSHGGKESFPKTIWLLASLPELDGTVLTPSCKDFSVWREH
jgi:hypothetical protein